MGAVNGYVLIIKKNTRSREILFHMGAAILTALQHMKKQYQSANLTGARL